MHQLLHWRSLLALLAILIVSGTIVYSDYLADKIAREERQKVEQWVEASQAILDPGEGDMRLPIRIIQDNEDIPIIWTNEKDSIIDHRNLDSVRLANEENYLQNQLRSFRNSGIEPITWIDPLDSTRVNKYYFGHSRLLTEVRYYPIVQLVIVALFIVLTLLALRSSYRSAQNQVWAGLAKETAHQLGTPVSSLEGWVEMLKQRSGNTQIVEELEKDVDRLQLISDRFSKIGSSPQLESRDVLAQVNQMVEYMRKRASGKVKITVHASQPQVIALVSGPLFDWVIENLIKNSLDSMEGTGRIDIQVEEKEGRVYIDVMDTGKGISRQHIRKVFKPGFTTKKRGWGLGLTLARRIIEQYHGGKLFVKQSEPGKGTTFRIELKNN